MSWFWFSVIAILGWSGSDIFSKVGSKPDDSLSHWKMVIAVGTVMGIHGIYMIMTGTPFAFRDIITYLPASFLYILAMIFGYAGLRYIELSISSPICNSSGAVASILCFALLGQRMNGLQFFAVFLICAAVFLLSILERKRDGLQSTKEELSDRKYTHSFIAVLFPILYCLIDGLGTFVDALLLDTLIAEDQANIAYEFTFLFMAACAFVYVFIIKKERVRMWHEKPKLMAALCETLGQYFYVFAIGANSIIAAPVISSYCLFSVLWSRIFLKEKLTAKHYGLIALAGIGMVILGIFDA